MGSSFLGVFFWRVVKTCNCWLPRLRTTLGTFDSSLQLGGHHQDRQFFSLSPLPSTRPFSQKGFHVSGRDSALDGGCLANRVYTGLQANLCTYMSPPIPPPPTPLYIYIDILFSAKPVQADRFVFQSHFQALSASIVKGHRKWLEPKEAAPSSVETRPSRVFTSPPPPGEHRILRLLHLSHSGCIPFHFALCGGLGGWGQTPPPLATRRRRLGLPHRISPWRS